MLFLPALAFTTSLAAVHGPSDVGVTAYASDHPHQLVGSRIESKPQGHERGSVAANAPDELLVRFDPGVEPDERAAARARVGVRFERKLPLAGLELVSVVRGVSLDDAESQLEEDDDIRYAEPNFYRRLERIPNDPYLGYLWGLDNTGQALFGESGTPDADIDAPEAWDVTTGNSAVSVAVVDSGVELDHPDLAPNIWTNAGESGHGRESNRRDDDLDGLVDDFRGWDWVDSDNEPADVNGHGTHVAGTIGARGDDRTGVAGVGWSTQLMALRVFDETGAGTVADLVQAYAYAGRKGASVVNASFGGANFSQAESDVIRGLPQLLFVTAAGNDSRNNDGTPEYPCNYNLSNILCVAASDQNDRLASFSNYGPGSVDLVAPGTSVLSTWPGQDYAFLDGTSMATPHVAGAAALLDARYRTVSGTTVKNILLGSVDVKPGLVGVVATGGRLNAARALNPLLPSTPASAPNAPSAPATGPPRDTSPPRVTLRVRRSQPLRRVLRRGVRARVGCSEPCHLTFRLLVRGRTARKRKLGALRQPLAARRFTELEGSARSTVVLTLRRRAARPLRHVSRAVLALTVSATDAAGNTSTANRRLRLIRR